MGKKAQILLTLKNGRAGGLEGPLGWRLGIYNEKDAWNPRPHSLPLNFITRLWDGLLSRSLGGFACKSSCGSGAGAPRGRERSHTGYSLLPAAPVPV